MKTASRDSGIKLTAILTSTREADSLLKQSIDIMSNIFINKQDKEVIEAKLKEIDSIKDLKEKNSQLKKIYVEKSALIQKSIEQEDTAQKVQQLNTQQKELLADALYNFILAGLADTDAAAQSTQLVKEVVVNPWSAVSFAKSLPEIKDIALNLSSQAGNIVNLGNKTVKIALKANIKVEIPKSKSDKPKAISNF
jgi:hypothetical protein